MARSNRRWRPFRRERGDDGATHGPVYPENTQFFCRSGPCPRTCRKRRMFRWGRPCLRTDRKRLMGWFRGHGPLLPQVAGISVGTGGDGVTQAREYAENAGFFGRSGPCPRNPSPDRRCASRAACPRRSGGPITLPPGGHGVPDDHHGRSGFGKCSHIFRKTGKKSGMVLFFSMIPVG